MNRLPILCTNIWGDGPSKPILHYTWTLHRSPILCTNVYEAVDSINPHCMNMNLSQNCTKTKTHKQVQNCMKTTTHVQVLTIIMYIDHALSNTPSTHMMHINLNMIFYTHIEHSPTKTTPTKHHTERQPPPHHTHTQNHNEFKCVWHWSVSFVKHNNDHT